jgi:hypothetical protein
MERHVEALRQAVEAVNITSPWSFHWFGKAADKLPKKVKGELPVEKVRQFLTFGLQGRLYEDFYCPGAARATDNPFEGRALFGRMDFVEALSQANQGAGGWDTGWSLTGFEDDVLVVTRSGLSLRAEKAKVKPLNGDALSEGAAVSVRFPNELLGVSPGFYMAVGDQPLVESNGVLRVYFNMQAAAATPFMKTMTGRLNEAELGFKLKILNDDTRFNRCDSAVLYIQADEFARAHPLLQEVHREYGALFGQRTPAFTKALARGVGLAESPPSKGPNELESFGLHRCRLVAEGLIEAYERQISDVEGRLGAVTERFAREGISLSRPHLNPGSSNEYDVFGDVDLRTYAIPKQGHPIPSAPSGQFLETAHAIGRSLVDTAVWHEDRCTWIGAQPPEFAAAKNLAGSACIALGPDLYGGVAGIALFLAELSRATGDRKIAHTAAAAARQASRKAELVASADRIGLYTGWTGMALALTRAGTTAGCSEIFDLGAKLASAARGLPRNDSDADLLVGRAGAITGLIALHGQVGDEALVEHAQMLADELIDAAVRDVAGRASWPLRGQPRQRNLTGLSHGAAGVAYGLLRLYEVVPEARWLDCALSAFAYEAAVYDDEAENWPDFRSAAATQKGHRHRNFATYWCHGAPGIAVSRMLAAKVAPQLDVSLTVDAALRTTRAYLELGLQQRVANFCLCHGLAGNSDILLLAGDLSPDRGDNRDIELARQVGSFGVEQYGEDCSWPCGVGAGLNQSLMLGLAGIGHFYLRLGDPTVPSVLAM